MTAPMVCPSNIGPKQRRLRRWVGVLMTCFSVGLLVQLWVTGQERWLRLTLFIPVFFAALGFLQARAETCVALALRGSRDLDEGSVPIDDVTLARALRRRALAIAGQAAVLAATMTAASLLLP